MSGLGDVTKMLEYLEGARERSFSRVHLLNVCSYWCDVLPESHGSGHSQPQRRRLAPPPGSGQSHGAPQSLLRDGLDELQHTFGLWRTRRKVLGEVLQWLKITVTSLPGPDLVHGPAAVHQHAHRLRVLQRLLQLLQLLLSRGRTVLLRTPRRQVQGAEALMTSHVCGRVSTRSRQLVASVCTH